MKKCKQIKTITEAPEKSPEPERSPKTEKSSTETCTTKKVTFVEKEIEAEKSENDDGINYSSILLPTKKSTKGVFLLKSL